MLNEALQIRRIVDINPGTGRPYYCEFVAVPGGPVCGHDATVRFPRLGFGRQFFCPVHDPSFVEDVFEDDTDG